MKVVMMMMMIMMMMIQIINYLNNNLFINFIYLLTLI